MTTSIKDRPVDVVVYGATGYTGKLVLEHLKLHQARIKIAVGGRSKAKLEKVVQEVGLKDVEVIVADSKDGDALRAMCMRAKVVLTLVGPYVWYGDKVIETCARAGTHYLDLNGEPLWHSRKIRELSRPALDTGAVLVPACGYDSVPSDIGALLAVRELQKAGGENVEVGRVVAGHRLKGEFSGGTLATAIATIEEHSIGAQIAARRDFYLLGPIRGPQTKSSPLVYRETGLVGGRFFMAFANTQVVRRSWGILESLATSSSATAAQKSARYGPKFEYDEFVVTKGALSGFLVSAVLSIVGAMMLLSPVRWLVKKFGQQSGDGPSETSRKSGWWRCDTTAHSVDDKLQVRVRLGSSGDPGYEWTSVCISEAALALVEDYDQLPETGKEGGLLTPATALGEVLVERLKKVNRLNVEVKVLKDERKRTD